MIFELSHVCYVVDELIAHEKYLLEKGYANSFKLVSVENPIEKQRWSKNWGSFHTLQLFTKRKSLPVELINYNGSDTRRSALRRDLFLNSIIQNNITFTTSVYDYISFKKLMLELGFTNFDGHDTFLFVSRFHGTSCVINVDETATEEIPIDQVGIVYPAFWVKDLQPITECFSTEENSESFKILVNEKLLDVCVLKLGPGFYIEFLQLQR